LVIGNLASLRESIHAPPDFDIDVAIVDKGMQLVVVHDGRGKDCHGDVHVSIVSRLHGGSKVEIFEITHHAAGTRGENNAIEKQFGSDEVSSFSADINQCIQHSCHQQSTAHDVGQFFQVSGHRPCRGRWHGSLWEWPRLE